MPELLCEIWKVDDQGSLFQGLVSAEFDRLRKASVPNATLLQSYSASAAYEVAQKARLLTGRELWEPPQHPDLADIFYTAADLAEQQRYLQVRVS
jgi:hypothetical protein